MGFHSPCPARLIWMKNLCFCCSLWGAVPYLSPFPFTTPSHSSSQSKIHTSDYMPELHRTENEVSAMQMHSFYGELLSIVYQNDPALGIPLPQLPGLTKPSTAAGAKVDNIKPFTVGKKFSSREKAPQNSRYLVKPAILLNPAAQPLCRYYIVFTNGDVHTSPPTSLSSSFFILSKEDSPFNDSDMNTPF